MLGERTSSRSSWCWGHGTAGWQMWGGRRGGTGHGAARQGRGGSGACPALPCLARGLPSHDACTRCVSGHRKLCAGCPGEALPVGTGGCCLSEASSWGLRGAGGLQLGVGADMQHIRELEQVLPKGRVSVGNFISSLVRWRSEMQEPEKNSYTVRQEVQSRSGPQ